MVVLRCEGAIALHALLTPKLSTRAGLLIEPFVRAPTPGHLYRDRLLK